MIGKSELVNTNKLLRNYSGCTGLKTGSTSVALFNLSASATRDNLSLIAVIMKGETSAIRFDEAKRLLDYGFSNFQYIENNKKGDILKSIYVDKGVCSSVEITFEENNGFLVSKNDFKNITYNINLPDKINAPVYEGQKIGEITYNLNNSPIASVNLVAKSTIKKLNFSNMLAYILINWVNLLR